jgi:hypothetical protein
MQEKSVRRKDRGRTKKRRKKCRVKLRRENVDGY